MYNTKLFIIGCLIIFIFYSIMYINRDKDWEDKHNTIWLLSNIFILTAGVLFILCGIFDFFNTQTITTIYFK